MRRRSFFASLAALFAAPAVTQESLIESASYEIKQHGVEVAFTPFEYSEAPVVVHDHVGPGRFHEEIARVIRSRMPEIRANIEANNALLRRLHDAKQKP